MNSVKIKIVKDLMKQLSQRMADYEKAYKESEYHSNGHIFHSECPKETGAIRRTSMDLTRALSDMRRPG